MELGWNSGEAQEVAVIVIGEAGRLVCRLGDAEPDSESKRTARAVYEHLDVIDTVALGCEFDGDTAFLRFDDAAQDIFDEWRNKLEHRLRGYELPPVL